jgi:hypothetical protein
MKRFASWMKFYYRENYCLARETRQDGEWICMEQPHRDACDHVFQPLRLTPDHRPPTPKTYPKIVKTAR